MYEMVVVNSGERMIFNWYEVVDLWANVKGWEDDPDTTEIVVHGPDFYWHFSRCC